MCDSSETLVERRRIQVLCHIDFITQQPFGQNCCILMYEEPRAKLIECDLLSTSKQAGEDLYGTVRLRNM